MYGLTRWIREDFTRAYLWGFGLLYVGVGGTWILTPTRGREVGIAWAPALTNSTVGVLWLGAGAACLAALAVPRLRRLALATAQWVAMLLALVFFGSWLVYVTHLVGAVRMVEVLAALAMAAAAVGLARPCWRRGAFTAAVSFAVIALSVGGVAYLARNDAASFPPGSRNGLASVVSYLGFWFTAVIGATLADVEEGETDG